MASTGTMGNGSCTVASVHRHARLPLLEASCQYAPNSIRRKYEAALRLLEETLGANDLSRRVVRALENLDRTNLWRDLRRGGDRA